MYQLSLTADIFKASSVNMCTSARADKLKSLLFIPEVDTSYLTSHLGINFLFSENHTSYLCLCR